MPLLDQPVGRLLLVLALLALASAGLTLLRRRDGVFRAAVPVGAPAPALSVATAPAPATPVAPAAAAVAPRPTAAPAADVVTAEDLGRPLGARATLLQLSSPGCATCPQVHRVLSALAAGNDGVVHVELDASRHMDLARRLRVMRTPTVLVLGPDGDVRARTSGRLDPVAAAQALAEHAPDLEMARG